MGSITTLQQAVITELGNGGIIKLGAKCRKHSPRTMRSLIKRKLIFFSRTREEFILTPEGKVVYNEILVRFIQRKFTIETEPLLGYFK
ncbi:hypothetical protein L4D05_13260 [Vibrio nomapromontoriensis]